MFQCTDAIAQSYFANNVFWNVRQINGKTSLVDSIICRPRQISFVSRTLNIDKFEKIRANDLTHLISTLSWRRSLWYRNQSIDWFLYDRDLMKELSSGIYFHELMLSMILLLRLVGIYQHFHLIQPITSLFLYPPPPLKKKLFLGHIERDQWHKMD